MKKKLNCIALCLGLGLSAQALAFGSGGFNSGMGGADLDSKLSFKLSDEEEVACATEICLAEMALEQPSMDKCPAEYKEKVSEFFNKTMMNKSGKFSPERTLKARRDLLYKCESGNTMEKENILAKYGSLPNVPDIFGESFFK